MVFSTKGTGTFKFASPGTAAGLLGVDASGNILFDQSPAASELDDLTDVDTSGAGSGDHLEYNGTSWVAATPSGGGVSSLNDLSDVTLSSQATNDLLAYNGSVFVNVADITVDSMNIESGGDIQFLSSFGTIFRTADGSPLLDFRQTSGATNRFLIVNGGTGGGPPALEVAASVDANVAIRFQARGTGDYEFLGVNAAEVVFRALSTGANTGMQFITKGTGVFSFRPNDAAPDAGLLGVDSSGNLLFDQSPAASALDDLSDVSLSSPADDNVLQFDGSVWVNRSDVELSSTSAYYLGDAATDGTWRFVRNGTDLRVELREGGTYNSKGSFTP